LIAAGRLIAFLLVMATGLGTTAWLGLLIASLIFRPSPSKKMRVLDLMLIITSVLMFLIYSAIYVATQAKRRSQALSAKTESAIVSSSQSRLVRESSPERRQHIDGPADVGRVVGQAY
jgi:hypothetical protein